MKPTLAPGVSRTEPIEVDRDRTIEFLGESLRVYSTPAMVKDIEYASLRLLDEHLDEGESTVGIHVSVDHLGATPLGAWVDVKIEVTEVDGRKVSLSAEVHDALEQVGRGTHLRFVIDVEKQAVRLREKQERLAAG